MRSGKWLPALQGEGSSPVDAAPAGRHATDTPASWRSALTQQHVQNCLHDPGAAVTLTHTLANSDNPLPGRPLDETPFMSAHAVSYLQASSLTYNRYLTTPAAAAICVNP
jgi:hypothetical protein